MVNEALDTAHNCTMYSSEQVKQVKLTLILVFGLDYLISTSLHMSSTFDHLAWISDWNYIICKIGGRVNCKVCCRPDKETVLKVTSATMLACYIQ